MKKAILLSALLISSMLISACSPIEQGLTAVYSAVSFNKDDRRSAGTIIDDGALLIKLNSIVKEDGILEDANISFMVYDSVVLMTGEVPNDGLMERLEKQVKSRSLPIKQLFNEVSVMSSSNYLSKTKDNIITMQVEILLQDQDAFNSKHVKVLTNRKIVYLMGAVTNREADYATNQAAKAKNVAKVVRLFNYLSSKPAKEIEQEKLKQAETEKKAAIQAKIEELSAAKKELQQQIDALK